VTLRILSPKLCNQRLLVKRLKAKAKAEKANKLKTKLIYQNTSCGDYELPTIGNAKSHQHLTRCIKCCSALFPTELMFPR